MCSRSCFFFVFWGFFFKMRGRPAEAGLGGGGGWEMSGGTVFCKALTDTSLQLLTAKSPQTDENRILNH